MHNAKLQDLYINKHYQHDHIKEAEVDSGCSMHGRNKKLRTKLQPRYHTETNYVIRPSYVQEDNIKKTYF
jgi:hypothetical protein